MTMPRLTSPQHLSGEHIQGGKECGGSVPFIVMSHRPAPSLFQEKPGLGSIQGLNLALLVGTEHQGLVGRIEVKSDHVRQFLDKLWVPAEFEDARPMRRETMGLPDTVDGLWTDPHHRSQRPRRPVGSGWGSTGGGQGHKAADCGGRIRGGRPARGASRSRPRHAVGGKPCSPVAHTLSISVELLGNLFVQQASRRLQHNFRAQNQARRSSPPPRPVFQDGSFVSGEDEGKRTSHRQYLLATASIIQNPISHHI